MAFVDGLFSRVPFRECTQPIGAFSLDPPRLHEKFAAVVVNALMQLAWDQMRPCCGAQEMHYNQHGLLLLAGQGIYRLNDEW